ncbi:hypothetical protein ACF0H5_010181 [Mactra antiquata]
MSGWDFSPTSNTVISSWNCTSVSSYHVDGRIILITANSFELFSTVYYAYLCISITKVTDYSYRYYINQERQGLLNNERIFIYPAKTVGDAGIICSSTGASDGEYQSWIQDGFETSAKVDCPWSILGQYGYTVSYPNGQSTCDDTTSQLDMCTDEQQMTFDYTTCSVNVAYSVSDTVWCVDNVPVDGTNYVMLFNGNDGDDVIDDTSYYRFTCMALSDDMGTASVSPGYCQHGQTSDSFPISTSGLSIGSILTFSSPQATCHYLSSPNNGTVGVQTSGAVTIALYTCDIGYTLWGTSTRTCESTNTWTDTEPLCSCAIPNSPQNGTVSVNNDGSVATYTCSEGYTLNGLSVRQCLYSTASWEGNDPTCVLCATLSTIAGQATTYTTDGTITHASFVCGAGFTLNGITSLTCRSDGTWNASQPDCVYCDFLTNPNSGTLVLLSDGTVSTANYACATDYTLFGNSLRTCQSNGTWDGAAPTCLCKVPSIPSNGDVTANGYTATYACNVGYTLDGDAERTCQTDGTGWSGSNPACYSCASLSEVVGGSYTFSSSGTVTTATYTCDVGYSIDGANVITCQDNGEWNDNEPTCVECLALSNPPSGLVSLSTSGTTTTATYACASQYDLNGNTIRLCSTDGTWTLEEPTCTCKSPPELGNGNIQENGDSVTYTCNIGYSLNGPTQRTCNTDGTGWDGSDPSCSECQSITSSTGGTLEFSTDGYNTQAAFTCDTGYTLNGQSILTCASSGTWDFTAPTCVQCEDISPPDSGSMIESSDNYITTVVFSCDTGYYLNGAYTISCNPDGTWSDPVPTCKCNFPSTPSNGDVSVSDSTNGPLATYTCYVGYSLYGLNKRVCMNDGTGWEDDNPICIVCQTISNPTSGSFDLATNTTHTSVIYTCDVGSTLDGQREQTCLSDGTWESSPPVCVGCSSLDEPNSGYITYSNDGSTTVATYSCVDGYSLSSSSSTLTCLIDGTWNGTVPYCLCDSPSLISNGELVLTDNLSTATYSCFTGYVLVGSATRYCLDDGSGWSENSPACEVDSATVGAATESDNKSWTIHIAVVVIAIVLFICLIVALALFIHLYLRLRQNNTRVSSAVAKVEPDDPTIMNGDKVPEVISETAPNSTKSPILKKYQNGISRPGSSVMFAKDVTTHPGINNKPHQLPPIEHVKKRSRRPEVNQSPLRAKRKGVETPEHRPKTPLKERIREIGLDRVRTPDLLSTAEFNYIQPVYSYELETPSDTHTDKRLKKKGKRIKTKRKRIIQNGDCDSNA